MKENGKAILIAIILILLSVVTIVLVFGDGKDGAGGENASGLVLSDDEEIPNTEIDVTEDGIPDTDVELDDVDEDEFKSDEKKPEGDDTDDANDKNNPNNKEENDDKKDPSNKDNDDDKKSYSTKLGAGHYVAGVDFPAGTYNITAVSGAGNVSSSNMFSGGLNEIMSNKEDSLYISSYKNATFEPGTKLSITSSVVINITSRDADVTNVSGRTEADSEAIVLRSGTYVAGTDFPEGVYTVVGTGAMGNVSSDNMYYGGLNEIMSSGNSEIGITEFKNATLDKGTRLTISGTTIKLIPVK